MYFLVSDIGTSSQKTGLVDERGELVASHSSGYDTRFSNGLFVEQDARDWWKSFAENVRFILREGRDPADIAAVSVSGHTPSLLPIDAAGRPLMNAMIWMDRRSETECREIRSRTEECAQVQDATANRIDPTYVLPKLLWLKRHQPDTYKGIWKILQANGYVIYKLTGALSIDETNASLTQMYDLAAGEWSPRVRDLYSIQGGILPPVRQSVEIVGEVTKEAARELGLKAGTPVIAGCNDTAASSLGAGVVSSGDAMAVMGSAGGVGYCTDVPRFDTQFMNYRYLFPRTWFVFAPMAAFAASLKWGVEQLYAPDTPREPVSYEEVERQMKGVPAGSGGLIFLPYLAGERAPYWNSSAKGVFIGLTLATRRIDMIRSIIEGTAYALAYNLELIDPRRRLKVLNVIGGGARSAVWNQVIADVSDRTVNVVEGSDGGLLGLALLAGLATKRYGVEDVSQMLRARARTGRRFSPERANSEVYGPLFQVYKGLYPKLEGDFQALHNANAERTGE